MANSFADNPFVIDTVSAVSAVAVGSFLEVYKILWASGSTADTAIVQDAAGVLKWSSTNPLVGTNVESSFNPPLVMNGVLVPTLTSGRIFMYVKRTR